MIGNKVVLTYKRKRLSSTPGLGFENECPSECQTLKVLKTPAKEDEKESTHESERKDPEVLNHCAVYNGDNNVVQCEHCHSLYDVRGLLPSNEHIDGRNICSSCAKEQDNLSTLEAVGSSCEDTIKVDNKPGFPLITFSRRSRLKKSADAESDMQEKLTDERNNDLLAVKESDCTINNGGSDMQEKLTDVSNNDLLAVKESDVTIYNGGPLDLSTDLTENDPNSIYRTASQEKKTSEDADLRDVDSLSVSKMEIEGVSDAVLPTESCNLKDTPPITEPASDVSRIISSDGLENAKDATDRKGDRHSLESLDLSKSLHDDSRIISSDGLENAKDATDSKGDRHSLESFDLSKPPRDDSRIISSDGLENAKDATDSKGDRHSLESFDLSKPPHESSGLVDCNITLGSSTNVQPDKNTSETNKDSADSTSGSHSVVLHDFPSHGKVHDLLDERNGGDSSLSQVDAVSARHSTSSHMCGADLTSESISQSQTSKTNFLQLFPEDKANDMFPLRRPWQEKSLHPEDTPSMLTSSNRKHLHFRSSISPTPSYGLSHWPNFDTKTPDAFQDTTRSQYPSDSSSLMRHKMVLDNIISKARAVTGNRSNTFSDNFDSPNAWSEEELDFLWIGVRRHGMGNWDSILRDPRLHFTSWRSPRELAKQWEEEQSKLLSTKPSFRTKRSRPTNIYNLNNRVEEPQVSLRYRGRSTFDPSTVNSPTRTGHIPHWLREVVSIPPRPVEQDAMSSGLMQWINKTFSNSDRTMGSIAPGFQPSIATYSPVPLAVMYPVEKYPISKPDEVIVIDSDASSEDTRSDDHR